MKSFRGPIIRLVVVNWLLGMGAGVLCASLILWLDLVGLRSLLARSDFWIQGLALLYGGFAVTFASLVTGTAVMMIKADEQDSGSC